LRHQYAIPTNGDPDNSLLVNTTSTLKGGDLALFRAAEHTGLSPKLGIVYDTDGNGTYLMFKVWSGGYEVENWRSTLVDYSDGEQIGLGEDDEDDEDLLEENPLYWVVPQTYRNKFGTNYISYGNSASLDSVYADLVLILQVPPANERGSTSTT
jgi:hypothetical protein